MSDEIVHCIRAQRTCRDTQQFNFGDLHTARAAVDGWENEAIEVERLTVVGKEDRVLVRASWERRNGAAGNRDKV